MTMKKPTDMQCAVLGEKNFHVTCLLWRDFDWQEVVG
jgi:hypothetical protein